MKPMYHQRAYAVLLAAAVTALAGCVGPAFPEAETLRETVRQDAQRHLADAQRLPDPRTLPNYGRVQELGFSDERMRELEKMGGPDAYADAPPLFLGPDLLGRTDDAPAPLALSLEAVIASALRHNIGLQSAQISPAISQANVIAAQAAFDWVFFADFSWNGVDEPSRVPVVGGVPTGTGSNESQAVQYTTGLRKNLTTGGRFTLSQGQTYFDSMTDGVSFSPDPSNQANLFVGYEQPLLRGFGSDVALADIELARNAERVSVQDLRQAVIDTITETERAYWNLVRARRTIQILKRSLQRGIETRDVLKARLKVDARPAEFSDAQATVERRRSDLVRAASDLRRASDTLKVFMNDPRLPIGSEVVLVPADSPVTEALTYSLMDSLDTALRERPDVLAAILGVESASINQRVARNALLPRLDFSIQATAQGLDRATDEAYDQIGDGDFVNWVLGLSFEQAIGNREAQSALRARQLQRLQAKLRYDSAVQTAVDAVVAALRQIVEQHQLIQQTRVERLAAAENLRTLLAQERTIASLDANFLNLKFQRQDNLARAEIAELQALVDYNTAIAELHRATGEAPQRSRVNIVVPDAGR